MVIRLLNKREVDKAKSLDRKREVDEGTKLAKRVDGLRETVSKEEKNLRVFRDKTVQAVMEELRELNSRKEYLKADLEELERQRVIAKIPLDKEWLKIKGKQEELKELEETLANRSITLLKKLEKVERQEKTLSVEEERISDDRERIAKELVDATRQRKDAQATLAETGLTSQTQEKLASKRASELDRREQDINHREKEVIQQLTRIKNGSIELANRERALADAYATLERTKKRYVK